MEELTTNQIITIILVLFVLVLAIIGIFKFNLIGTLKDLFPDFTKGNLTVKYSEELKLKYPGLVGYYLDIPNPFSLTEDFYYWYDSSPTMKGVEEGPPIGWKWTKPKKAGWLTAGNIYSRDFQELEESERNFILNLSKKSPEEGLKLIVERTIKSKNEKLQIYVEAIEGGKRTKYEEVGVYESSDKRLQDLDALIGTINRVSRKIIR